MVPRTRGYLLAVTCGLHRCFILFVLYIVRVKGVVAGG